jgi:hypothetical protein
MWGGEIDLGLDWGEAPSIGLFGLLITTETELESKLENQFCVC